MQYSRSTKTAVLYPRPSQSQGRVGFLPSFVCVSVCLGTISQNAMQLESFVRYCGQGSSLLWTPALRPLCRSNEPAQGEEENW